MVVDTDQLRLKPDIIGQLSRKKLQGRGALVRKERALELNKPSHQDITDMVFYPETCLDAMPSSREGLGEGKDDG